MLTAAPSQFSNTGSGETKEIGLALNDTIALDADTTLRFAEFFPDYAVRDGQVYRKSNEVENRGCHLVVISKTPGTKPGGKAFDVWFPPMDEVADNSKAPYQLQVTNLKMQHFTGLQVSHEPGQWGVWSGVVLMAVGLSFVFYVVH